MPPSGDVTVLVVDDEEAVADAYSLQIETEHETRVAYGGIDALDKIDEAVDVVLLDRRMPDMSGDEVLEKIRDQGYDCRVIMVTAVDPDFDIVEMPFDDYLQKPVNREEVLGAIEQQLSVGDYDDKFSEFVELTSKIELLEDEKPVQELEDNEDLQEIKERAEELKSDIDETVEDFDDPETAFQDLV
jgi:DNA-binding response OmpR family regulator